VTTKRGRAGTPVPFGMTITRTARSRVPSRPMKVVVTRVRNTMALPSACGAGFDRRARGAKAMPVGVGDGVLPVPPIDDPGPTGAGGSGADVGTTGADALDGVERPPALTAVSVNVYAVPPERFVMVQLPVSAVTVQVAPPGLAVMTCDVTVADASPATAVGALR
jgi:hypothetical protein